MKKFSILLCFVVLVVMLFTISAFAATEALTKDDVESIVANDGNERANVVWNLVDGDVATSGIYTAGNDWFGAIGDTVTIVLKKEMLVTNISVIAAGNYTESAVTVYDAEGNVVATSKVIADGNAGDGVTVTRSVFDKTEEQALKVKKIEIEIASHKWNNIKTHKVCEVQITAVHECSYVAGEQQEDGSITYTCSGCADEYVINNSAVNGEYFMDADSVVFNNGVVTFGGAEYNYTYNVTTGMIDIEGAAGVYFQVIDGKIYFRGATALHQHTEDVYVEEAQADGSTRYTCQFCGSYYEINNSAVSGEYFMDADSVVFNNGVVTFGGAEYNYTYNVTTGMIDVEGATGVFFQVIDGKIYFRGATALHQHTEDVYVEEAQADGSTRYTCQFCGSYYEINNSAVSGEYFMDVDSVVFNNGVVTFGGAEYNYTYNVTTGMIDVEGAAGVFFQVIDGKIFFRGATELHQHTSENYIVEVVGPTCIADGYTSYTCKFCGYSYNENVIEASDEYHNYESFTMLYPSCVATGIESYTCTECNDNYTEELPMDPESHNYWPDWETKKDPTCIEGGYEKLVCQDCGAIKEEVTDPDTEYGHSWEVNMETYKDATCAQDGYRERKCLLCGAEEATVLDKSIYGYHDYVADEETYKEATCAQDGYANYVCTVCGDSYEEETPASPWAHDYIPCSNYSYWTCSVCGDSYFSTSNAMTEDTFGYELYLYSGNVFNVCTPDYSFDEYYHYTYELVSEGVYAVTLTAGCDCHENNGDTLGLVGGTCTFTLTENGMIATVVAADGETTYSFDNVIEVNYNSMLNGTYSFNPEEGTVFTVKFEDGIVYVLEDTMGLGLSASFEYSWNPNTGVLSTTEGYFYVDVTTGDLYYGRGWLLSPVEEGGDGPDEPIIPDDNYGEWFSSMIVMTENSYGFNIMGETEHPYYTFTAEEAGTYFFYIPEGLGLWSKASYDSWGNPEVEFMGNTGTYVSVELDAGEEYAFSVGAETEQGWEIVVNYLAPEHVCEFVETERVESTCATQGYVIYTCECGETKREELELAPHNLIEIPAVRPTPSVTGYTAGTKCVECGNVIDAPVAITVTEMADTKDESFRVGSVNLSVQDNISINFWSVVAEGYSDPYMVFVFNGVEYVVTDYTINASNGRYGFNFAATFPQYMGDTFEAYVYAETANGEYSVNHVDGGYSVMRYITTQLAKEDADLTTVMSDILYMGAMTQVYMNYKTDALVTDLVKAEGYTLTPTAFTSISKDLDVLSISGDRTTGVDWKAVSLAFGSTTEAVLKFAADDIDGLKVKIQVGDEVVYYDPSELVFVDGRYVIYIDMIKSCEYDEVITATFERGGAQVGSTLTYSVNTFLARNYENASYTEAARNLMKALYTYGASIVAYFA